MMVGIALVDYKDYLGNYKGVTIANNEVSVENSFVGVGVAMGSRLWHCPGEDFAVVNQGATIKNNIIKGNGFGYGYVVNGVKDWLVEDNQSTAFYKGIPGKACGGGNAQSAPFLIDRKYSRGTFQPEFKEGRLEKIYDVKP